MNMTFFKKSPSNPLATAVRGFTLVEIVVSLMIFSIVAVVALGALVKIVSANKKAQTLQSSISNLNFALDALSREMRVGNTFLCESASGTYMGETMTSQACTKPSATDDVVIAFKSNKTAPDGSGGVCALAYAYRFKYDGVSAFDIQKAVQPDCGTPISSNLFSSILDPQVVVTGFFVDVSSVTVNEPFPRALIRISGYAGTKEKEKTLFDVQTAISPRVVR